MISETPFENGKYVVRSDNGVLSATRHGEPWRDLAGDKLVGAMLNRILAQEKLIIDIQELINKLLRSEEKL